MNENSEAEKSSISQASTAEEISDYAEEISDYWDSHSLATHWDQTHEVEFEVRVQHPRQPAPFDS